MADFRVARVERFWAAGGEPPRLNRGFLPDPEHDLLKALNPTVRGFEDLQTEPCLVLLGEPGLGKTTAVAQFMDAGGAPDRVERKLKIDLHLADNVAGLDALCRAQEVFRTWMQGAETLDLFLDSLDECKERASTLGPQLGAWLKQFNPARLRVRLICRTAQWPYGLQGDLEAHWGHDLVRVVELCPLRREDVSAIAVANGVDPGAFLDWIFRLGVDALGARPITLRFLLSAFKAGERDRLSQTDLYRLGCLALAAESDIVRVSAERTGSLTPEQRVQLASRVAVLMFMSGKTGICSTEHVAGVSESLLTWDDVVGAVNAEGTGAQAASKAALTETLQCGLFRGLGVGGLTFAHQTVGEYLASRALILADLSDEQLQSLLCAGTPERHVFPQLAEIAAWVAPGRPGFFEHVLARSPEVLLQSDAAGVDPGVRLRVVAAIMDKIEEAELSDRAEGLRMGYPRLACPGLEGELRPFVRDRAKGTIPRRAAMQIARAADARGLAGDLLLVAVDTTEAHPIRVQAAYGVWDLGTKEERDGLRPLIDLPADADPDQDLHGVALSALWPEQMTTAELVTALVRRRQDHYMGAYGIFLHRIDIQCVVQRGELRLLLQWLEDLGERWSRGSEFEELSNAACAAGLRPGATDEEVEGVARILLQRAKAHEELFLGDGRKEHIPSLMMDLPTRLRLLMRAIGLAKGDPDALSLLAFAEPPLLVPEEVPSVLDETMPGLPEEVRRAAAVYLLGFMRYQGGFDLEMVWRASQRDPVIGSAFDEVFSAVPIDGEQARMGRKLIAMEQEIAAENAEHQEEQSAAQSEIPEKLHTHLQEVKDGDLAGWWKFCYLLIFGPEGRHDIAANEYTLDIEKLPGWSTLRKEMRTLAIECARTVLRTDRDESLRTPLKGSGDSRRALGWLKALVLVRKSEPTIMANLEGEARHFAQALCLSVDGVLYQPEPNPFNDLVREAFVLNPEAALPRVKEALGKRDARGPLLRALRIVWTSGLTDVVLEAAGAHSSDPQVVLELLDHLSEADRGAGLAAAADLVRGWTLEVPDRRTLALVGAEIMLRHGGDESWNVLEPVLAADDAFAREVFLNVAGGALWPERRDWGKFTPPVVGRAFLMLERLFPTAEDPDNRGVHSPSQREEVAEYRGGALASLRSRGTPEAVAALRMIEAGCPHLDWMPYFRAEAGQVERGASWVPPTPAAVAEILGSRRATLVNTEEQLLDLLTTSLVRYQALLQGETPAVERLWNVVARTASRPAFRSPKDETALSDEIKLHLENDLSAQGVIANREVEVQRAPGPGLGQRTDIHVDAVALVPRDGEVQRLKAIVEVKGSWNADVATSLHAQLVERYMRPRGVTCGLYVVGWFACEAWDDHEDPRRGRASWNSFDEAKVTLAEQAQAASAGTPALRVRSFVLDARWA